MRREVESFECDKCDSTRRKLNSISSSVTKVCTSVHAHWAENGSRARDGAGGKRKWLALHQSNPFEIEFAVRWEQHSQRQSFPSHEMPEISVIFVIYSSFPRLNRFTIIIHLKIQTEQRWPKWTKTQRNGIETAEKMERIWRIESRWGKANLTGDRRCGKYMPSLRALKVN